MVNLDGSVFLPGLPDRGGPEDPLPQGGRTWSGDLSPGSDEFLQSGVHRCGTAAGQWTRYYQYFDQFGLQGKDRDRSSGRGGDHHAQKGKYGAGGAGDGFLWPVFSDHAHPADHHGRLHYQRGNADHASSWRAGGEQRTEASYRKFSYPDGKRILSEETSATMRYILEQVVAEGSGKKAAVEGFPDRRKDRHFGKASQKPEKIYFLLYRLRAGRRSPGDRADHHR